jgi:hypothetical protein
MYYLFAYSNDVACLCGIDNSLNHKPRAAIYKLAKLQLFVPMVVTNFACETRRTAGYFKVVLFLIYFVFVHILLLFASNLTAFAAVLTISGLVKNSARIGFIRAENFY